MYISNLKIKEGFTANATTPLGGKYSMRIEEEFDGPMEVFTVAYNGCISMCAKGYFVRAYGLMDLSVEEGVLENIKLRCKVSHLLSSELQIQYNILPFKK